MLLSILSPFPLPPKALLWQRHSVTAHEHTNLKRERGDRAINRRIRPGTLEMKAFQPTFYQHLGVLDSTKQYSCATLPMQASHGPQY